MNRDCVVGLMCGLGIGVAVGILTAPRSGEQTRAKIRGGVRERTDAVAGAVREQATSLRNSASELMQKGRQQVERRKEDLAEAFEAGKQAYQQASQVG